MPKHTKESWSCDICGARFDYKNEAIVCENLHMVQGRITSITHGREHSRYPSIVSVVFEDGEIIDYYS